MATQQPPDLQQTASCTNDTNHGRRRMVVKRRGENDSINRNRIVGVTEDTLKEQNSKLKDENKELRKQIAALRSELAQAQAQAASSERTSQEPNPFTKLITHNYEVSVPLVSHDQINKDFLSFLEPELTDMHQKNNLLRFVLFGERDKWFCFKDVCEKSPDDIEALVMNTQDSFYYPCYNRPHSNSDCKFMIGKFRSHLEDRITLRRFQRPS